MSHNPYSAGPVQQSPYSHHPSQSRPSTPSKPPAVLLWQMIYDIAMVLLYLAIAAGGAALYIFADTIALEAGEDPAMYEVMGMIYGIVSFLFAIPFVLGAIYRKGMLGWVLNLILIILGLTSCVTWPATIPLMIFRIRDKDRIVAAGN